MKFASVTMALMLILGFTGAPAYGATGSKKLMVNVHVQSKGMPRVAHFKGELPLGGLPQHISRIPTYNEPHLPIVDFYDLHSAFAGSLPRFLVTVGRNSPGVEQVCLRVRGNIAGLAVKSNFDSIPGGYHEGYGESEVSCFDVNEVEKTGGAYLVYLGSGASEQRKRVAIYLNVISEE